MSIELNPSNHLWLSPSPPAFNPYQHKNLFQWVNSLHQSIAWVSSLQSVRVSVSASVLTMNIQDWFPLGLTGLLFWQSKGHSSSPKPQLKSINYLAISFFIVQLLHQYKTTGKTIILTRWNFAGKIMSLLFNMLSTFVIYFLPRDKRVLISWLQSPYAMILEIKK